ncbi:NAD-dependent epimerase/dehydratase family protein, partial [Haloarcula sp. CBA1122]
GIVVDRVIADYAAGAVERLVEAAQAADLLVVEGQGALAHPAYSGVTTSILHGSAPDALVMCHEAGREAIHGYESFDIPPLPEYVDIYERLAAPISDASVVAGMLNTRHLDDSEAADAVAGYSESLGAPATDPVRHGVPDEVLDAIL